MLLAASRKRVIGDILDLPTEELTREFYAVSEKLYQQANPQGAQGGAQPGPDASAQGGQQYYDADYKVVDDDDQNKK